MAASPQSLREHRKICTDLVPDASERRERLFRGASNCRRILKAVVNAIRMSGIDRATLPGFVAHRRYVIERIVPELIDVLRAVTRNVDNGAAEPELKE